jgi:Inner membrane component of T3SS, cytoplasmic domain
VAELVLHIVEGPHEGENEIAIAGRTVELGGAEGLELTLGDAHVAERHARISPSADALVLEDLGSESGTYVNEQPVHGPYVLRPGDRIRVGLTVLELRPIGESPGRPRMPEVPDFADVLHHVPEQALSTPEPAELPPFRVAETPAAFLPEEIDKQIGRSGSPLLKAWRDAHVKEQTQVAAFAVLAVTGLGVGLWLGFH